LGTSGTWKKYFSLRKEKFNGAVLLLLSLFFFFTASRNALFVAGCSGDNKTIEFFYSQMLQLLRPIKVLF